MTQLIGKKAPDFTTQAVISGNIEDITLSQFQGRYVVLFFYPLDFTFVCPTELHAFQERLSDFSERNTTLLACSVDSCFSHLAWQELPIERGGISGIEYPLLSDLNRSITRAYNVLKEDEGIAYRALFIIDRSGIIRHMLVNDLALGRSVDEVVRILDAIHFHETNGQVCPANWKPGKNPMKATFEGLREYFSIHKK